MSLRTWRARLRTVAICAMLEFAALSGSPMRPEEIKSLMQQLNQPKLAHVLPAEEKDGDPPIDDEPCDV